MNSEQQKTLKLAGELEQFAYSLAREAAAELRRQHVRIEQLEKYESDLITERDFRDEIIDRMADAVLGTDRAEWSSSYDLIDAAQEVEDFMSQLEDANSKVEKYETVVEKPQQQTLSDRTDGACDVLNAILSCPHVITNECVVLHYDPRQPRHNALSQLRSRISATKGL